MAEQAPLVRTDDPALCLRLTATASDRLADPPREHLTGGAALAQWFVAVGLLDEAPEVGHELLAEARALREAIYRAARALAVGGEPRELDTRRINAWAARNDAHRVLDDRRVARWTVPADHPARTALAIVATDAVNVLTRHHSDAVKLCESPACAAVFLDTSRGHTRRWCSMSTCGNRAKKATMKARRVGAG